MTFWIFMLISVLLIPIIMIVFGRKFMKAAPKKINFLFGYRTAMSMKNEDTWSFAHKHFGRNWYIIGIVLLPVSLVTMLFVLGKTKDLVGNTGTILSFVQLFTLLAAIIPTERALKKNFDKHGNRK